MSKQPYIPLYTGDYLKDTRILTLEVRGAWVDLMIFMWGNKEKGTVTGTMDEFALMLGCNTKKASLIIESLHEKDICDFEVLPNGQIKLSSRRMLRDIEISKVRKKAGQQGGNPNLLNQNPSSKKNLGYPSSDIDNEGDSHLDLIKKEQKQKITDSIFSDEQFVEVLKQTHRNKNLQQAFSECYNHHAFKPNPPTELWQWRQKLNTWLTIKSPEKNQTPTKKRAKTLDELN